MKSAPKSWIRYSTHRSLCATLYEPDSLPVRCCVPMIANNAIGQAQSSGLQATHIKPVVDFSMLGGSTLPGYTTPQLSSCELSAWVAVRFCLTTCHHQTGEFLLLWWCWLAPGCWTFWDPWSPCLQCMWPKHVNTYVKQWCFSEAWALLALLCCMLTMQLHTYKRLERFALQDLVVASGVIPISYGQERFDNIWLFKFVSVLLDNLWHGK